MENEFMSTNLVMKVQDCVEVWDHVEVILTAVLSEIVNFQQNTKGFKTKYIHIYLISFGLEANWELTWLEYNLKACLVRIILEGWMLDSFTLST